MLHLLGLDAFSFGQGFPAIDILLYCSRPIAQSVPLPGLTLRLTETGNWLLSRVVKYQLFTNGVSRKLPDEEILVADPFVNVRGSDNAAVTLLELVVFLSDSVGYQGICALRGGKRSKRSRSWFRKPHGCIFKEMIATRYMLVLAAS